MESAQVMPDTSAPPPPSQGPPSGLPQPALRRLTAMLDEGFVGRGAPTLQMLGREGEGLAPPTSTFRPWLLVLLPAVGALIKGAVSRLAPETRGGGSDARASRTSRGISPRSTR